MMQNVLKLTVVKIAHIGEYTKDIELYPLSGWIVSCINYISIKQLF
jgi:hypothetical protein